MKRYVKLRKISCVVCGLVVLILILFAGFPIYACASTNSCVATVVIFSSAGSDSTTSSGSIGTLTDFGHAFVLIENISNSTITVGKMSVGAGMSVTIGTWRNKDPHDGVWYNLESYVVTSNNAYNGRVSIEEDVTATELSAINSYINSNDEWSLFSNCSTFASGLWNTISSREVSCGFINTPANLKSSIMEYEYDLNRNIDYNSNIGYYNGYSFVAYNPFSIRGIAVWETSFTEAECAQLQALGVM